MRPKWIRSRIIELNDADLDRLPEYDYSEKGINYEVYGIPENWSTINAIPIEQLLSILPKYDDYIHTKTYPYNEYMEDIYSKGHEEGWNACLKAIKEELDFWEKENEIGKCR